MSAGIIMMSIALVVTSAAVFLAAQTNTAQDEKIRELESRIEEWEQLAGPKMDNMTQMMYEANRYLEAIAEQE